jgi:predicted glycosyltransferase
MMDYEYTERRIFNRYSTWLLIPKFITDERLKSAGLNVSKVIHYNGFKEELYLSSFVPEKNFRETINIDKNSTLIVIRPPGMLGNYHDEKSEGLLIHAINYFTSFKDVVVLISSRSQKDRDFIKSNIGEKRNLQFLEKTVDGLQLVYSADIVLSGGGTMNRESALLGTKTYSIFTAKKPYLDEYLASQGRLAFIENKEQIDKIEVKPSNVKNPYKFNKNIVKEVTNIIVDKMNG